MKHPCLHRQQLKQQGFTVLELMIATTVFSVILLVAAAGILNFSHDYFKGINSSNTQAVARSIMSDVTQTVEFSNMVGPRLSASDNKTYGYCIDNTLYTFMPSQQVSPTASGLVRTQGNCTGIDDASLIMPALPLSSNQRELLSDHMMLGDLSISSISNKTYVVSVVVAYGDDDLLEDSNGISPSSGGDWSTMHCKSDTGSQFCAISRLSTTVQQRLDM